MCITVYSGSKCLLVVHTYISNKPDLHFRHDVLYTMSILPGKYHTLGNTFMFITLRELWQFWIILWWATVACLFGLFLSCDFYAQQVNSVAGILRIEWHHSNVHCLFGSIDPLSLCFNLTCDNGTHAVLPWHCLECSVIQFIVGKFISKCCIASWVYEFVSYTSFFHYLSQLSSLVFLYLEKLYMLVKSFFMYSLCVRKSFAALFTVLFFRTSHYKTVN